MSHFVSRTEDFDARHRVAEFESVAANICKLAIEPADQSYASATSIAVLPDAVIADTVHSPCRMRRTAALSAETGDNILLTGGFSIRQDRGGAGSNANPGQVYLDPSEVPGLARFVPRTSRVLYASIPRAALLGLNPALRQVVGVTPQWRMLIAYARVLHAKAAELPPEHLKTAGSADPCAGGRKSGFAADARRAGRL